MILKKTRYAISRLRAVLCFSLFMLLGKEIVPRSA